MKIEAGKFYRDRVGYIVGPVIVNNGANRKNYPFAGRRIIDPDGNPVTDRSAENTHRFTSSGKWGFTGSHRPRDLIEEVEPPSDTIPGFPFSGQWGGFHLLDKLRNVAHLIEALPPSNHASKLSELVSGAAFGLQELQRTGDFYWPQPVSPVETYHMNIDRAQVASYAGADILADLERAETSDSPDYSPLASVLDRALAQASSGKGKERHANGKDFLDQPIMEIGRMVGVGYQTGQAMKKAQEATGMLQRNEPDRAVAELLGAINYLAAAVLLIEESGNASPEE